MKSHYLKSLFNPTGTAVIGASDIIGDATPDCYHAAQISFLKGFCHACYGNDGLGRQTAVC